VAGAGYPHPTDISCVSVSCLSSLFCVAVDGYLGFTGAGEQPGYGRVATYYENGSRTGRSVPDKIQPLASVSCPTATFCVAVDMYVDALLAGALDKENRDLMPVPTSPQFGADMSGGYEQRST